MVRPEVLRRRLQKLSEYIDVLQHTKTYSYDTFAADPEKYGSAERFLQRSIEAINDMAAHVVVDDDLGTYETARDLAGMFEREGGIDDALADRWRDMTGFRNILVHEYVDINRRLVYDVIQDHLSDVDRLRRVFARFL